MSRIRRSIFVLLALLLSLTFSFSAWALDPIDALSTKPEASVYASGRIDNLNGLLKTFFAPEVIDMFASIVPPEELQNIRVFSSMASQIPAESFAWISGVTADGLPFAQAAASMPSKLQPKLDLVSSGKATAEDMATLFLGEGGLLLAAAIKPTLHESDAGPYYLIEDKLAIAAKDNLLFVALSSQDLTASMNALKDEKARLALQRKFKSPSYFTVHLDMVTLLSLDLPEEAKNELRIDPKAIGDLFKAPLRIEFAFDSKPESFLVSAHSNIFEALKDLESLKAMKPTQGASIFLVGDSAPFYSIAGASHFEVKQLKVYPELAKIWGDIVKSLEKRGLTEKDVEDLFSGSLSFVLGNDAQIMGHPSKGSYLALTGRKGAAAKFVFAILSDEQFTKTLTVAPVKAKGWDTLVMVDPALLPVSLLLGAKGDTLFFGLADPKTIDKQPKLPEKAAVLLKEKLFIASYLDTHSFWNYLKSQVADANSQIGAGLSMVPPPLAQIVRDILDAELSISFVKAWAPAIDTSFVEFSLVDVPQEKRLLGKLIKAVSDLDAMDSSSSAKAEDESPLVILLAVKESLEAYIAANPDATLDDQQEAFSEVVSLIAAADGTLYAGLQVPGDNSRLGLIEEAKKFALTGSAGLTIAPDGSPYDGQEIVWIKIERAKK